MSVVEIDRGNKMSEEQIKKNLLAASVSVEIAIENLQNVLGGENLYLVS